MYQPISLSLMKPYDQMTKAEAQKHFEWFLTQIPARLASLREYYSETTGLNGVDELDMSPRSLITLWSWFEPRVLTVQKTEEELHAELQLLPEVAWPTVSRVRPSFETLGLVYDAGVYLGETLIRNSSCLHWGFRSKPKKLYCLNQPAIMGFPDDEVVMDPKRITMVLCWKVIKGTRTDNALVDAFNHWLDKARL